MLGSERLNSTLSRSVAAALGRRPRAGRLPAEDPAGQPGYLRPVLGSIVVLAALLYTWNITSMAPANFYLVAVKSMSVSWKAFVYGALDPGSAVTIDKIPGAFFPQALSVRIFGYHAWAVALPQALEGVVSVVALYRVVRRWQGPVAGVLAAGLFTLTPVLASMFGLPMEDSLLIMCLVLAADALMTALQRSQPGPLILAGFWVGIGFEAKMLEAWIVLPAFALTYLAVASGGWRRRLVRVALATSVLAVVSLAWVLLVTLTPTSDRPYIDGSTSNNAFSMVFGYNGFDRFGYHVPGAAPPIVNTTTVQGYQSGGYYSSGGYQSSGGKGGYSQSAAASASGSTSGWGKLFGGTYGTQIGWLYPLALLGLVLGLLGTRRAPRTDPARGGFLLWGLWALTFGLLYSGMVLPHTAYLSALAPPIAALSAAGVVLAWNGLRDGTDRWALPAAVAAEAAWSAFLSSRYSSFLPWLTWAVVAVAVVSAVVMLATVAPGAGALSTPRVRRALVLGAATAGTVAMVATPAAWSLSVFDSAYRGNAIDASAGPGGDAKAEAAGFSAFSGPAAIVPLNPAEQRLDAYLETHQGGASYIAATDSWLTAMPYIMATGQAFRPLGGFTGEVPDPTLAQVRQLVNDGRLRYVFLGPGGSLSLAHLLLGLSNTPTAAITAWAAKSCAYVPPLVYGGTPALGTLYRCAPGA